MRESHFAVRVGLSCVCLAGLLAIAGCSEAKIKRYPVNCSVTVDGKPAAGVMVVFCPVDGAPQLMRERPIGITDSEGKFQLTTLGSNDGVPAGQYKVLVRWPSGTPKQSDPYSDVPPMGKGPDQLKGKYFNLDRTPLTATIESDTKELPTFALQSK
jgi:hypothetical protein